MGDLYDIQKVQKKEEIQEDNSILEEAKRVEDENYEQARDIRMQLGQAAIDQQQASDEFRRQGEVLENAKKSAVNIHKEAKKGEGLAEDIKREGSWYTCRCACIEKLFNWFKKDNSKEIEEISARKYEYEDEKKVQEEKFTPKEEFVPGQNKTDKELVGILNTVKGIRQEAESQSNEAKKQKAIIRDINKVTKESDKVIKDTDKQLKEVE